MSANMLTSAIAKPLVVTTEWRFLDRRQTHCYRFRLPTHLIELLTEFIAPGFGSSMLMLNS